MDFINLRSVSILLNEIRSIGIFIKIGIENLLLSYNIEIRVVTALFVVPIPSILQRVYRGF
jgi:hypothetical protein